MGLAALAVAGVVLPLRTPSWSGAPVAATDPVTEPRAEAAPALEAAITALDLVRPAGARAAEDFTLPTLGGGTFGLSGQRGKAVLVNFWATWCPPCLAEMPAMERLWRRHRAEGFVIVAVSVDADAAIVPRFIEDRGVSFPVAFDPEMKVAGAYGVRALPASFVIDHRGRMAALALGPRAWDTRPSDALLEALRP